jgi:Tfp pilus assembly PilM family ATPase
MFNKLTQPHFPRAAAGLRRESVSVVSLGRSGRAFSLRRAATVELASDVLHPSFDEANILQPDELLAALREAASEAGLQTQKRWSVSLPADSARMSLLTLETEPKTQKEREEILNWKAERTFGASPEELRLAFQPLAPDASKRSRYFAVAVRLDVLGEYEELFENLGWNVGLILPRHLSEMQWLMMSAKARTNGDSLLVSSQADGFTALLLHNQQPAIVRSILCEPDEREDELYRLLLYYRDRLAGENSALDKFLVIGEGFGEDRLEEISNETLGHDLRALHAADVGLLFPENEMRFEDIAAPAALASLALR